MDQLVSLLTALQHGDSFARSVAAAVAASILTQVTKAWLRDDRWYSLLPVLFGAAVDGLYSAAAGDNWPVGMANGAIAGAFAAVGWKFASEWMPTIKRLPPRG